MPLVPYDRRGALIALGAALLSPALAFAQSAPDPRQPIRYLERALTPADGRVPAPAAVRAAVERSFDTGAIARAVLASHANGATAAQLARFREALTGRIVRDLLRRLRPDRRGQLEITHSRPIGAGEWLVTSRVLVPGERPRAIGWRVGASRGAPRISDVLGSGTSMVRVLRNEYGGALRRLGIDGVATRMEERNRRRPG